ncbi:hypothetical protein [Mesorhizobium loti]|uniref:hypothetical protein n=1 Tax=Rhizobium loti TaxID=381 RepID=UPI00041A019F|nr:hypothetical protein [Mesorhizobium loti]
MHDLAILGGDNFDTNDTPILDRVIDDAVQCIRTAPSRRGGWQPTRSTEGRPRYSGRKTANRRCGENLSAGKLCGALRRCALA